MSNKIWRTRCNSSRTKFCSSKHSPVNSHNKWYTQAKLCPSHKCSDIQTKWTQWWACSKWCHNPCSSQWCQCIRLPTIQEWSPNFKSKSLCLQHKCRLKTNLLTHNRLPCNLEWIQLTSIHKEACPKCKCHLTHLLWELLNRWKLKLKMTRHRKSLWVKKVYSNFHHQGLSKQLQPKLLLREHQMNPHRREKLLLSNHKVSSHHSTQEGLLRKQIRLWWPPRNQRKIKMRVKLSIPKEPLDRAIEIRINLQ